jgi:hypothetical protein
VLYGPETIRTGRMSQLIDEETVNRISGIMDGRDGRPKRDRCSECDCDNEIPAFDEDDYEYGRLADLMCFRDHFRYQEALFRMEVEEANLKGSKS